jgi:DNA-binding transcriptional LysR family regulator
VLDGRSDAGFVAYPTPRRGIDAEVLWRDRLVLVCSPSHRLARRSRVPLSVLGREKFIAFDTDQPTRKALDRALKAAKVRVCPVMEFDNIETVKRTVEIGDAVSILPETVLANERKAGSLIPVELASPHMWRPIGVITKRNRAGSPAQRCFLDMLRKGVKRPKLAKAHDLSD